MPRSENRLNRNACKTILKRKRFISKKCNLKHPDPRRRKTKQIWLTMKKGYKFLSIVLIPALVMQSCIVSGPKYTHVENVMQLSPGMTMDTVNSRLGIKPYDINVYDSTGNHSYIYKYRTTDRKTVPFLLKETNGRKSIGKYMDLVAYYDSTNVAYRFESRTTDSKLDEKKLNVNTIVTIITVIVPTVLVYLGIKKSE